MVAFSCRRHGVRGGGGDKNESGRFDDVISVNEMVEVGRGDWISIRHSVNKHKANRENF